ncbi:general transcription factor 3C polypeptide 2 [Hyperolius riggenbachi]|uniref:general transcription factor 3C polypeptide 2 n=1 Tax=Hyperolius riggenbachi TaxID=752182 RepID=UPI0035A2A496
MDLAGSANIQTTCKREMVQPTAEDSAPSPTLKAEGSAVSLAPSPIKKGVCDLLHPLSTAARSRNPNSLSSEAEARKLKGLSNLVSGDEASLGDCVPPPPAGTLLGEDSAPSLIENGSAGDAPPASIVKVPKKRGRKSKAELLLIRAAEEQMAAMLPKETKEEEPELEHTPSGRPRRRAAKEALKYLHDIAEELTSPGSSSPSRPERPPLEVKAEQTVKRRSNKRKRRASDDDGDLDFVVSEDFLREEEEREEEAEYGCLSDESEDDINSYNMSVFSFGEKPYPQPRGKAENGFHNSIMLPVWHSAEVTMEFWFSYNEWYIKKLKLMELIRIIFWLDLVVTLNEHCVFRGNDTCWCRAVYMIRMPFIRP